VEKNIYKAIELFELSSKQSNEYAAYQLGKLFLKGEDIEKDIPSAVKWFLYICRKRKSIRTVFTRENIFYG